MKAFWLPSTLLALLIVACLSTGNTIRTWSMEWNAQLDLALDCAQREQWESAQRITQQVYTDWQSHQAFLHTVMEHDELDKADSLLQTALWMAEEEDSTEFRIHICQSQAQLELLREMQAVSLQNLL